MTRPTILAPVEAVGLLAAMLETPLLADLVPLAHFRTGSAPYQVAHALVWDLPQLMWRGEALGSYRVALHELLRGRGQHAASECAENAIAAVRACPALIDSGRARLTRYAAGSGRLLEEPTVDAPKVSRLAADGLRLHGEATAA